MINLTVTRKVSKSLASNMSTRQSWFTRITICDISCCHFHVFCFLCLLWSVICRLLVDCVQYHRLRTGRLQRSSVQSTGGDFWQASSLSEQPGQGRLPALRSLHWLPLRQRITYETATTTREFPKFSDHFTSFVSGNTSNWACVPSSVIWYYCNIF